MSERQRLNPRHKSINTNLIWVSGSGAEHKLQITFGFGDENKVKEAFCASFKRDSDIVALANDSCILLSRLLQMGDLLSDISHSMSENNGRPASILGAIIHKGLEIENG